MPYSPDQLFRVSNNISITNIEDESVVLDLNSGNYYGLNHVGTMLLNELQHKHTLREAITEISRYYQIRSSIVEQDTHKLVAQLVEQNILKPNN